jgi:hypothetical protein
MRRENAFRQRAERMNALIDGMIRSFNERRKGRNGLHIGDPG